MNKYMDMRNQAIIMGEKNACAPIAVSIATGEPFQDVLELFRIVGRKKGKGAHFGWTSAIVKHLGFNLEEVKFESKTVRTLARELPEDGTFLIRVRGHILCYKDGIVHDWSNNRCHRILEVYEVY